MATASDSLSRSLSEALAARALQYASPLTIPKIQRSARLADALQQMQAHGGENIRTGGALGSNLLAEALLQFSSKRADKDLAAREQADRDAIAQAQTLGLPPPGGPPPGGGDQPVAAPASPPPVSPAPATAPAPAPQGAQYSRSDLDALTNMVFGEARGEPTQGKVAAADVALNRAKATGRPVADVVAAPHQFAGYQPGRQLSPDIYQSILKDIGPALAGQDVTGGADHFFNPELAHPSWGQGPGQMIGHHKFMALNDQRPFAGAPSAAQAGVPAAASVPPQPAPLQVSTGPDPSMPAPQGPSPFSQNSAPPPPNPPPGAANSPAQGPAPQAGGSYSDPPHGLGPTSAEWERMQMLLHSGAPALIQQGMEMAAQLQQRYRTPEEAPKDMRWDAAQGHYVPKAPWQTVAGGAPNRVQQVDPMGQVHFAQDPSYGPIPEGAAMGPQGTISRQPQNMQRVLSPEEAKARGYALGSVVQTNPLTGQEQVVQQPQVDAKALQTSRDSWRQSDETKKASEAIAAYNGLVTALQGATKNTGVLDTAAVDSFLRGINPGMGARNATVNMFLGHLGLPQELEGHLSALFGKGYLTPETIHQMMGVIHSYGQAHAAIAQRNADNDLNAFSKYGVNAQDLGEGLTPFAPEPQIHWMPGGGQAGPAPTDPLEAEAIRRGMHKGPDGKWAK